MTIIAKTVKTARSMSTFFSRLQSPFITSAILAVNIYIKVLFCVEESYLLPSQSAKSESTGRSYRTADHNFKAGNSLQTAECFRGGTCRLPVSLECSFLHLVNKLFEEQLKRVQQCATLSSGARASASTPRRLQNGWCCPHSSTGKPQMMNAYLRFLKHYNMCKWQKSLKV